MMRRIFWGGLVTLLVGVVARGDIIVCSGGSCVEGKVISQSMFNVSIVSEGYEPTAVQNLSRGTVSHVYLTDERGGLRADPEAETRPAATVLPPDPVAPPIVGGKGPTYCVIPLHGAVGETVLASALEKSLADAVSRQPTVLVLDVDSPGGSVEEAKRIIAVLHKYNKKLRIVAFAGQDLSAAAIITLSAKEIYVKASSTIGAATAYVPGKTAVPTDIQEKIQSAWRAVARNSAEEGGHEPMLADAMIENDMDLHWDIADGKPVVREGPGDRMICRKGKVLTLTSHEAVSCGLAAGGADDYEELGKALKLENWTEMKGLGPLFAEVLPKRVEKYNKEMAQIGVQFVQDMQTAAKADPSQRVTAVQQVVTLHLAPQPRTYGPQQPYMPQPGIPNPYVQPGMPNPYVTRSGIARPAIPQPGMPINPMAPEAEVQAVVTERTRGSSPATWKSDSLTCLVALYKADRDLDDGIALAAAYGQAIDVELLKEIKERLGVIRVTIYGDRNKFVTTPKALKTLEVGGQGEKLFSVTLPSGAPVVGFRAMFSRTRTVPMGELPKEAVATLEPLYGTGRAAASGPTEVVAKDGYVVGGLMVSTDGMNVLAVKVIFMGLKNGQLDKTYTYVSDWLGAPGKADAVKVAGTGALVVGTHGKRREDDAGLAAIGLLVVPEK